MRLTSNLAALENSPLGLFTAAATATLGMASYYVGASPRLRRGIHVLLLTAAMWCLVAGLLQLGLPLGSAAVFACLACWAGNSWFVSHSHTRLATIQAEQASMPR